MTITTTRPEDAARAASLTHGLDARDLTPLRAHATSVYHLPHEAAVARVSPLTKQEAVTRGVTLTHWLAAQGYPATEPLPLQPTPHGPYLVTFWHHYPQHSRPQPTPEHLGHLLRLLHDLPPPPAALPVYQPLAQLSATVARSSYLTPDIRTWLTRTITELLTAYRKLHFPLGTGLIHGDAYPGNTLWDGTSVRLGDWDEAATGPRELDLANTHQGVRFGRTPTAIEAFTRAYGHDPRGWPGLPVLIAMRDLHTLGSFIRRADTGDPHATRQLKHRLSTLCTGSTTARWDTF
ncbi:phosphotransferase enzyme family protein [Streptomyces roseifaciens]|uniref:phosphotransferase enzyme family protein n=1 Tax=Streptomyces roseifaciens TaxID=1488406 RepID=UPI000717FAD2|nr:phosphotransferase [Streptomyces roseifaciens]